MSSATQTDPQGPALDAPQKHRTVGISMHPTLEQRAKARAEALGLKFSPYVTLCIEAELKGFAQIVRDETLDLESAMRRAREYMDKKTASIDFEVDVEAVLDREGVRYERFARVDGQRIDFLLTLPGPGGTTRRMALECRYNIRQHYAVALGQSILLRAQPDMDAVGLVVPYMEGFEAPVLHQFREHGIHVTTPDQLGGLIRKICEAPTQG